MISYSAAAESTDLPQYVRDDGRSRARAAEAFLVSHGWQRETLEREHMVTTTESDRHSPYRRYCIDNYLTISEHALSCRCSEARFDDIQIRESPSHVPTRFGEEWRSR